jgi:hypothetical protein
LIWSFIFFVSIDVSVFVLFLFLYISTCWGHAYFQPWWRTKMVNQGGGSEWEPIKILLEGDRGSNKMNTTCNTHLRLNYPSWSRPRSHWSATDPRNQQTTFRAKTHQHTQRKLAQLATCATPVRPMACAGQTGDTGQTSGQSQSGRWLQQPHNKCSREPQWHL